ncbi:MAG: serine/threonine-protein kinase, partial [Deltaproteobacteria bacterium]|nr:serine/threonine-protein kinase [Deltaproteobacteria bacterium]
MLQSFLGETLGNYRVVGKIASGGMGDVYLAEHVLMRKKAVVKFLRQELTSRTDMLTRFFHEAESAGHIAHP